MKFLKKHFRQPFLLVIVLFFSQLLNAASDKNDIFYDIQKKSQEKVPGQDAFIILDNIRKSNEVFKNSGVVIEDLGDGILSILTFPSSEVVVSYDSCPNASPNF